MDKTELKNLELLMLIMQKQNNYNDSVLLEKFENPINSQNHILDANSYQTWIDNNIVSLFNFGLSNYLKKHNSHNKKYVDENCYFHFLKLEILPANLLSVTGNFKISTKNHFHKTEIDKILTFGFKNNFFDEISKGISFTTSILSHFKLYTTFSIVFELEKIEKLLLNEKNSNVNLARKKML